MGSPAPRDVFWRLLVWLLLLQVSSATNLYTAYLNVTYTFPATNHSSWLQDEIGLYGQDSPRTFVEGSVYLAEPMFGCDGDTLYRHPNASGGWVALIQRGNGCTFSDKINVAADNGAVAAVIFNDDGTDNRVIQMSHPGTSIVAVMIGHKRGMELVIRLKQGFQITIAIEVGKQHSPWMSHYSVFFVSISFFIVTAATVGYFIFYSARRLSSLRQQNCKLKKLKAEAKKAIGKLQVRTLKSGDPETGPDADACAVCIDSYKPGDVLSILTCNHFFHKSCIEPWLLEHRTCPMCKCDILKALGVEMDVEEPAQIIVADFRSFSAPEDLQSETTSHTHSETASSGYASMHGADPLGPPENTRNDPQEEPPQYDNLAFESDAHRQNGVRT